MPLFCGKEIGFLLHLEENVIQVKLIKFKEISNGMNYKLLLTIEGSADMYIDAYFSLTEVSDFLVA